MYLIIQGHSKVKTYGGQQAVNETMNHSPKMVPVETVKDPVVTHVVSEDDNGNMMNVAHMHKTQKIHDTKLVDKKKANSTVDSLLSLLDSSFMGFFMNDEQSKASGGKKPMKLTENKSAKHDAKHTTKISSTKKTTTTPSPTTSSLNLVTPTTIRDIS